MLRKSFSGSWASNFLFYRYEKKHLKLIGTMLFHSLLKQMITSGSSYVMTFTDILSLKTQGTVNYFTLKFKFF